MNSDELINEAIDEMCELCAKEIAQLSPKQQLLFGYLGTMRLAPSYCTFPDRHPQYSDTVNPELFLDIAKKIKSLIFGSELRVELQTGVNLLLDNYVPDLDDFGSERATVEAALSLDFLARFVETHDEAHITSILTGILDSIDRIEDSRIVLSNLQKEAAIRDRQIHLITCSSSLDRVLMARCTKINEPSPPIFNSD